MNVKEAIQEHVFADGAGEMLDRYLRQGKFSGAWLDTLCGRGDDPEVANRVTPADLVAVSTLAVNVPGWTAVQLLDLRAGQLSGLLAEVPADL